MRKASRPDDTSESYRPKFRVFTEKAYTERAYRVATVGSNLDGVVGLDATTVLRVITPHDREGSADSFYARHERAFLAREDEKDQK